MELMEKSRKETSKAMEMRMMEQLRMMILNRRDLGCRPFISHLLEGV